MKFDEAIAVVREAVKRDQIEWPDWPSDIVEAADIVLLEAKGLYDNDSMEEYKEAAIKTVVMALRFLMNLHYYKRPNKEEEKENP